MKQPTNKVQAAIPDGATPKVIPVDVAKAEQEAFAKAIDAVCVKHGFNLVAQPVLKPAFDGSFTVSAQMVVVRRQA